MYSQRFGTVQREIRGPTPKVVVLRAKPPKGHVAEQRLERIQHSHQEQHAILAAIKSQDRDRLKVEWEQHHERKFWDSLAQARINDAMQGFIINTEERRNKLRELLAAEENEYFAEMQMKEETMEEKKDRMREKTRLLKEKKEKERQDFVAEKLEQQFRESCDELRSELFSDHQKKVCEERKAQVAFNEELKRQKLVEEQMFAKLWEEDRLAKERREASEARRQRELAENMRLALKAQITGVLAQRRVAQRQKEEEARLVKALEERIAFIQQEYREQQDLDEKLIHRALQDLQQEAEKKQQKKAETMREQKIYLTYLAQQRKEDKAQEKELDRMLEEEAKKQLAQKDRQLRLEKEARKQLLQEVMCTRKLQLQEKLQRKVKEQEELAVEQERINEGLKELYCDEQENFSRRYGKAQEYRKQLDMQMAYQQQIQEAEKEERRLEFEAGVAENKMCQDKIQEVLATHRALPRKIHPMRKACPSRLPP
ncbi:cilia- and flagella-associated protein 53 isoform X2 [Ochotona princeps]|uniref:cilia- and flagella-associated protein 53 isoform X2 n=1 Tax=Ochotona princeps TaxID=9978 RepID=UPI002714B5FA|nr:cilia- and flagella-associated protein 53 isoform X2 [Ochotona princeps]